MRHLVKKTKDKEKKDKRQIGQPEEIKPETGAAIFQRATVETFETFDQKEERRKKKNKVSQRRLS